MSPDARGITGFYCIYIYAIIFMFLFSLFLPQLPVFLLLALFLFLFSLSIGISRVRVGTPTGYGLDDRKIGVRVLIGSRIFTSLYRPEPGALSLGLERQGREASAEGYIYIHSPIPLNAFRYFPPLPHPLLCFPPYSLSVFTLTTLIQP
jgi:hypothetical protein